MSEVKRFKVFMGWSDGGDQDCVKASDYDALAAQRDEGLAREAELQSEVQRLTFERQPLEGAYSAVLKQNDALQQRLAEAEKLPRAVTDVIEIARKIDKEAFAKGTQNVEVGTFRSLAYALERLASPGCVDGEKAPALALNLPRRKVKTEYSTPEEDAQADAWNAALDAVQEMNR